jgi:hypothetical protein
VEFESPPVAMETCALSGRPLDPLRVAQADGLPAGPFLVAARLLPDELVSGDESKRPGLGTRPDPQFYVVGATGFEPPPSSVSANGGEALCGSPFSQVAANRRCRSYAFSWRLRADTSHGCRLSRYVLYEEWPRRSHDSDHVRASRDRPTAVPPRFRSSTSTVSDQVGRSGVGRRGAGEHGYRACVRGWPPMVSAAPLSRSSPSRYICLISPGQ